MEAKTPRVDTAERLRAATTRNGDAVRQVQMIMPGGRQAERARYVLASGRSSTS